ncbi:MAG: DUF4926 domain-containing protein [Chloroflexi bacterium]|nr:DUF4926 domain-containing protein [Chloroflexota bacterium]MCC6895946.1 DUF4926 domain-containing protein [Anaerolineae bacterium]
MAVIEQYDVVALTEDVAKDNLRIGSVGTVIEKWNEDAYEVAFSAEKTGIDYAQVVLKKIRS